MDTVTWVPPGPYGHQSLSLLFPGHHRHPQVPLVIFVMGGPGCGKGTQCKNMTTKYGLCHVGLGQLLHQEAQHSTRQGQKIPDIMLQGLLVLTVRAHGHRGGAGGCTWGRTS